jgi:predicted dienelactone hydrolase
MQDVPSRPLGNRVDSVAPNAPELASFGPFPVGVTTLHLRNPDQIDVLGAQGGPLCRHVRPLTVELWYPAAAGPVGCAYPTLLRDGKTPIILHGRACRDAMATGRPPLVILSHGYPGNRYLMAHLGETLASRGYAVASIDHTDSTYADKGAFLSTLLNRPLDLRFVIDSLTASHSAQIDTDRVAVVGYSMGAYGALLFGGAGLCDAALAFGGDHAEVLQRHLAGSPELAALIDPRVKAIIPIGLWGGLHGFWSAEALSAMTKPCLMIAGSADTVSGYETGIRKVFAGLTGSTRHLLTFDGAGHNAAAPIPAPDESWTASAALDFLPAEHYADPVWDTVWMNAVAQHVIAAFVGLHLQGDTGLARYLTPDLTGFGKGAAKGLRLETLRSGE